uniref:Uncharacterized protein n=1 Tax=viral metagenome TaxID=1070528 RepID=A0A6M3LPD4_9ZZZZ
MPEDYLMPSFSNPHLQTVYVQEVLIGKGALVRRALFVWDLDGNLIAIGNPVAVTTDEYNVVKR